MASVDATPSTIRKYPRDASITPTPSGICDINPAIIERQKKIVSRIGFSVYPNARATTQNRTNSNPRENTVMIKTGMIV